MVRPETGLIHFYNALSGEKLYAKGSSPLLINRPDGLSLQLAQASFGTVRSTDYKGECAACNSIVLPTA